MRKIETQMIAAINGNKCWRSGNTQVVTNAGLSTVYLHGNKIALIDDDSLTIFDGGWQTPTTKCLKVHQSQVASNILLSNILLWETFSHI